MEYKEVLEDEYQNVNVFQIEDGEEEKYRLNRYYYDPEANNGNGAIITETIQDIESFLDQATPESFYELFEQHRDEITTNYEFTEDPEQNADLLSWFVNAASSGRKDDSEFISYTMDENSREILEDALCNLRNTVAMYKAIREMDLEQYEGTFEITTLGPDGEPTGVSMMECYSGRSFIGEGENREEVTIHIGRSETGELYVSVNDNDFEPIKQPLYPDLNQNLDIMQQEVPAMEADTRITEQER